MSVCVFYATLSLQMLQYHKTTKEEITKTDIRKPNSAIHLHLLLRLLFLSPQLSEWRRSGCLFSSNAQLEALAFQPANFFQLAARDLICMLQERRLCWNQRETTGTAIVVCTVQAGRFMKMLGLNGSGKLEISIKPLPRAVIEETAKK